MGATYIQLDPGPLTLTHQAEGDAPRPYMLYPH